MGKQKLLSIITPVHNEAEGIKKFINDSLVPVAEKLDLNYELIIVNDGSTDNTLKIIQILANQNPKIKILSLSRNFGKEPALSAGLRYAKGDAALTIDADGQQPPKLIPDFIKKWNSGAEIITGVRSQYTKHGLIQKLGSKLFYKLLHIKHSYYYQEFYPLLLMASFQFQKLLLSTIVQPICYNLLQFKKITTIYYSSSNILQLSTVLSREAE